MNRQVLALPLLALMACASTPEAAGPVPETHVAKQDGQVSIQAASRQFIGVEAVELKKNGPLLRAPARVAFKDTALSQLGAPFSGRVVRVHVQTGDSVNPSDPLVTLDCPDAASARTTLATATSALREARAVVDREKRMLEQGVGIEREKVTAETKLADAEAEFARAQTSSAFAGPGVGTVVIVRSPIAGKVIGRKATVGMTVQAGGDPIVEIGDPAALWVVADVFERDLPMVKEGSRAQIELPSLREPLEGKVISVGSVVTSGLRTVPVRIELSARADQIRPGMFGRVRIESADMGLSLPTEAVLIRDGRETTVYVETAPLSYVRRPVVVAQPVEGRVQVLSGLTPGEKVVVKGALLLDGSADQLL